MGCCDGLRRRVDAAARRIAGGVRGLSSAAILSERPGGDVFGERSRLCFGEPGRTAPCDRLGLGLVCRACGCLAMAKIRVASEACPLGKWGAVPPERAFSGAGPRGSRALMEPPQV